MTAKISEILISLILVGGLVGILITFIGAGVAEYQPVDYDNSTLEELYVLEEINYKTEQLAKNSTQIKAEQGALSVLDSLFDKAFNSILIAGQSINFMVSMTNTLVESAGLGVFLRDVRNMIAGILFVLTFVIIMRFISKVDI